MSENEENKNLVNLVIRVDEVGNIHTSVGWEQNAAKQLMGLLIALGTGELMPSIYKSIGLAKELSPEQVLTIVTRVNEAIANANANKHRIDNDEPIVKPTQVFHANFDK